MEQHRGPSLEQTRVLEKQSVIKTRVRLGYTAPLGFKFSFNKDKEHKYLNPQVRKKGVFPGSGGGKGWTPCT